MAVAKCIRYIGFYIRTGWICM